MPTAFASRGRVMPKKSVPTNEFGLWLAHAIYLKGWSQDRVEDATKDADVENDGKGISQGMISNLVRGARNPSRSNVHLLARTLDADLPSGLRAAGFDSGAAATSPSQSTHEVYERAKKLIDEASAVLTALEPDPLSLLGRRVDMSALKDVPFLPTTASAGTADQNGGGPGTTETAAAFLPGGDISCIEISGDCMEPYYSDGEVVFVREQATASSGQKVIAQSLEDDSLVVKMYRAQDGKKPWLEPVNNGGSRQELRDFRLLGVVVGVWRSE